jgi:hypothetical protein
MSQYAARGSCRARKPRTPCSTSGASFTTPCSGSRRIGNAALCKSVGERHGVDLHRPEHPQHSTVRSSGFWPPSRWIPWRGTSCAAKRRTAPLASVAHWIFGALTGSTSGPSFTRPCSAIHLPGRDRRAHLARRATHPTVLGADATRGRLGYGSGFGAAPCSFSALWVRTRSKAAA